MKKPNKEWFTPSLISLKRDLGHKYSQLQKHPSNPYIRGAFFKCLKVYRKARKSQMRKYNQELIEKLDSLHEQNPKSYWKLLDQLKRTKLNKNNKNELNVSLSDWKNHFQVLNNSAGETHLGDENFVNKLAQKEEEIIFNELDFVISEDEIEKAIKSLKNSKASGLSMIINEMVKYGQLVLTPLLCKLFNLVFSSGLYPKIWSLGYITPLHKSGSTYDPSNYRGITISDIIGKLFNRVMNNRLNKFFIANNIINNEQIGFIKGRRTTDHIFVLKTLVDKYVKRKSQPLYACFVDFKRAFDTVWHIGLLYKLKTAGVGTKFYNIIKNMYSKTEVCVKIDNHRTEFFKSKLGVRQGDNLSPSLFNLYVNDLPSYFDSSCDPVTINETNLNCLMYADDVVLLSTTEKGIQSCVDKLSKFTEDWKMTINNKKTKILVFNKGGRLKNIKIKYHDSFIECVQKYTYLGVVFNASGIFTSAKNELHNKGIKALFKLRKTFWDDAPKVTTLLHIFNHTIKPILLYGSEIWGYFSPSKYIDNIDQFIKKETDSLVLEKVHTKFCKFVLGVRTKSSNQGARGELGSFPILFDVLFNMVKYWCHILKSNENNSLILEALKESEGLCKDNHDSWIGCIKEIFKYLKLEYIYDNPSKFRTNYIFKQVKYRLKTKFKQNWTDSLNDDKRVNQNSRNKLRTYRKFKSNFSLEPYLLFGSRQQRQILTKFRISAHNLHIEKGRYCGTKVEDRICNLCKNGIEDEVHFLFTCPALNKYRDPYIKYIDEKHKNFSVLSDENKLIWLLSSEDKQLIMHLFRLLSVLFQERDKIISNI